MAAANYVDGLPELAEFEQRQFGENSQVFDRNGVRITVLPNAQNRRAIPIARMSPWILKATVAIEDKRFYEHEGVDPKAIFRAAVRDVQAGEIKEGGSTLTQQLVSQLFIEKELSFDRKIREAWLALQLEDEWSKDKILATYLNTVFYGHNAYGIEAASQAYFNIPARAPRAGAGGAARGPRAAAVALRPLQQPGGGRRAPQRRAAGHAGRRATSRRPSTSSSCACRSSSGPAGSTATTASRSSCSSSAAS